MSEIINLYIGLNEKHKVHTVNGDVMLLLGVW